MVSSPTLRNKIQYRLALPVASRVVPERWIGWLHRNLPIDVQEDGMWSFWYDVSYDRYCRNDLKNHPELGDFDDDEQW